MAVDVMIAIGIGAIAGALLVVFCIVLVQKIYTREALTTDQPNWTEKKEYRSVNIQRHPEGIELGVFPGLDYGRPPRSPNRPWNPATVTNSANGLFSATEAGPGAADAGADAPSTDSAWLASSHGQDRGQRQENDLEAGTWAINASELTSADMSNNGRRPLVSQSSASYLEKWFEGCGQVLSWVGGCAESSRSFNEGEDDVEVDDDDGTMRPQPRGPPSLGSPVPQPRREHNCSLDGQFTWRTSQGEHILESLELSVPIPQSRGSTASDSSEGELFEWEIESPREAFPREERSREERVVALSLDCGIGLGGAVNSTSIGITDSGRKDSGQGTATDLYMDLVKLQNLDTDFVNMAVEEQSTAKKSINRADDRDVKKLVKPVSFLSETLCPARKSLIPRPPPEHKGVGIHSEASRQCSKIPRQPQSFPSSDRTPEIFFSSAASCEGMKNGLAWPFACMKKTMTENSTVGSQTQESTLHLDSGKSVDGFSIRDNVLFKSKKAIRVTPGHTVPNELMDTEWTLGSLSSISEDELELCMSNSPHQQCMWRDNYLFDTVTNNKSTGEIMETRE